MKQITTMKVKIITLIVIAVTQSILYAKQTPITLTSPVIEFIDGKSWGIDGEAIGYMRQVALNVITMYYGERQKDKQVRIGLFTFRKKKYSIKELMAYEKKLTSNINNYSKEEYQQLKTELQSCLDRVKEYFIKKIEPFMNQARGAKQQVVILISEWATKRKRADSHLLCWIAADENAEFELFRDEILSFAKLEEFCLDLISYLGDLIRSCPKANAQFEKLKEKFLAQQN